METVEQLPARDHQTANDCWCPRWLKTNSNENFHNNPSAPSPSTRIRTTACTWDCLQRGVNTRPIDMGNRKELTHGVMGQLRYVLRSINSIMACWSWPRPSKWHGRLVRRSRRNPDYISSSRFWYGCLWMVSSRFDLRGCLYITLILDQQVGRNEVTAYRMLKSSRDPLNHQVRHMHCCLMAQCPPFHANADLEGQGGVSRGEWMTRPSLSLRFAWLRNAGIADGDDVQAISTQRLSEVRSISILYQKD